MKKLIISIISFQLICLPVFCEIKDDFVLSTLNSTKNIEYKKNNYFDDDLVENLDKNLKIKSYSQNYIEDYFAENNKNKNIISKIKIDYNETIPAANSEKFLINKIQNFDFSNSNEIKIKTKNYITTKKHLIEGDYVEFETVDDVMLNNKQYPKGSIVKARIETVSLNKTMGVPSELIIGNFTLDKNYLQGQIDKIGANRALWVYPTTYIGALFFGLGLLFIPIRGGHAKIRKNEIFKVNYVQSL